MEGVRGRWERCGNGESGICDIRRKEAVEQSCNSIYPGGFTLYLIHSDSAGRDSHVSPRNTISFDPLSPITSSLHSLHFFPRKTTEISHTDRESSRCIPRWFGIDMVCHYHYRSLEPCLKNSTILLYMI